MPESKNNEIIVYQPDETIRLDVRLENETVWLNRQQLALLFGRDVKTIGKHIANALAEELAGMATVAKFATVQMEGSRGFPENFNWISTDTTPNTRRLQSRPTRGRTTDS